MISKGMLALVLGAAATTAGAPELIDMIKPAAEYTTAESTLRSVLANAQLLENLGSSRKDALATSVEETPNAEGLIAGDDYIEFTVGDTCLRATFGKNYKYQFNPC